MIGKSVWQQLKNSLVVACMLTTVGVSTSAYAAPSTHVVNNVTNSQFSSVPVISTPTAPPLVLLGMSVDQQLFTRAYTDYTDLDGNGEIDTTYDDDVEYYGYFNSDFCYEYDSGVFRPEDQATSGHECSAVSGDWSGNFLNWATMTRMDVVRRVLYGGYRSKGDATVLQRALLPQDSHAFVKVASDDVSDYTPYSGTISICNVTNGSGISKDLNDAASLPQMKIAKGAWPQWSATKGRQCVYDEEDVARFERPSSAADRLNDYNVLVRSCVGKDKTASYCKDYSGTTRPIGLLQRHGDDGSLRFGLVTGSYNNNDKGGVLRKTIKLLAGNPTVTDDEVLLSDGAFTGNDGIIKTLNNIRIAGWDYNNNRYYDCYPDSISISAFKSNAPECRDWGNPLSEIYLEALRYLEGESSATLAFDADDSASIGVGKVAWDDPMSIDEYCANCAIVLLSTGRNSFDTDDLGSASDLPVAPAEGSLPALNPANVTDLTDLLGKIEGISSGSYIVGNVPGDPNNGSCTAKTVSALGDVEGLCPDKPLFEGSYNVAGLAYYAKLADLRPDAANPNYPERQNVDTYAVALAENLPDFEIVASNGNTVRIVPTCKVNPKPTATKSSAGWNDCGLVDVTVVEQSENYGQVLITWDNSLWGNDYDMDGIASIEYCSAVSNIATQCLPPTYNNPGTVPAWNLAPMTGDVQIRVSVPQAEDAYALQFGFIMAGSIGMDGVYSDLIRRGGDTIVQLNGGTDGTVLWDTVRKFAAAPTTPKLLENPLYYAAKYGNFNDQDGDGTPGFDGDGNGSPDPGDNREWDTQDVNGNPTPDGIPDSFYPVSNPSNIEVGLNRIFNSIISRVASGTAAAVVANNTSGDGAVYQALYNPVFEDAKNNRVEWAGVLQGIFIDRNGNLREDLDGDATLDNSCVTDPVIEIFYDSGESEAKLRRFSSATCDKSAAMVTTHELDELKPIWNARDQLANLNADMTQQRRYAARIDSTPSGGRYIFTSDGTKGSNIAFDDSTIALADAPLFNVADEAAADNIVNFIRGNEGVSNFRSRTVDFDNDNVLEVWRLGDIVHSTPAVAGVPGNNYETRFGDKSYAAFKAAYQDRRQVVYVGANDGMIHAFNGGFFDQSTTQFKVTRANSDGTDKDTKHPLGSELWAYVPYNLLPHLQWLTDTGYEHVYYMDGEPRLYDVNIFPADTTHVEGWGTILVVGMRFGGAPVLVDADADGSLGSAGDKILRSAYIVLDVTDPEQEPVLLGELTHDDMGFTVGVPALVKARAEEVGAGFTQNSPDSWNLLIGSGPDQLATAESTGTAKLFGYNLATLNGGTPGSVSQFNPLSGRLDLGIANSFVGSLSSVDWDSEFSDDAVYFGISGGSVATATGTLMRQRLDDGTFSELITGLSQSFISAPDTLLDGKGQQWVFGGTGRLYVTADKKTTEQQTFYGLKDPLSVPDSKTGVGITTPAALVKGSLLETTGVQVFENSGEVLKNGSAFSVTSMSTTTVITKFGELVDQIDKNFSGWYNNFKVPAGNPSERNVSNSVHVSNLIIYTSFEPGAGDTCDAGTSFLNVRHFNTGTAALFSPIGVDTTTIHNSEDLSLEAIILGEGLYSAPVIHRGSGGVTIITQGSTGAIGGDSVGLEGVSAGRQSWRQIYEF